MVYCFSGFTTIFPILSCTLLFCFVCVLQTYFIALKKLQSFFKLLTSFVAFSINSLFIFFRSCYMDFCILFLFFLSSILFSKFLEFFIFNLIYFCSLNKDSILPLYFYIFYVFGFMRPISSLAVSLITFLKFLHVLSASLFIFLF